MIGDHMDENEVFVAFRWPLAFMVVGVIGSLATCTGANFIASERTYQMCVENGGSLIDDDCLAGYGAPE